MKIHNKDIAIITTEPVVKSFENEDAYLHAVITLEKDDEIKQTRTYSVRTDMVKYIPVELPVTDENGEEILDENEQVQFETKQQLVWIEQKQDWARQEIPYLDIDAFASQISKQIPSGLPKTKRDALEMQLMFLLKRQSEAPWGIPANKWRLRNDKDLLK